MRLVILAETKGNKLCHWLGHAADPSSILEDGFLIFELLQPERSANVTHEFAVGLVLEQSGFLGNLDHAVRQNRRDEVDELAADH